MSGTRRRWWRALLRSPAARAGAGLLALVVAVALAAPWLAPCPPEHARFCGANPYHIPRDGFATEPRPPGATHHFGTTSTQHDVYYGVVWGTRTALRVGLLVTVPALIVGALVGAAAGYAGGWLDEGLMRVVDVFMAFPFFIAAATTASLLRTHPEIGQSTLPGIAALAAFGWMGYARLVRADVRALRGRDFVVAARALGASEGRILLRHVVPNAIQPVLALATLDVGTYVLAFSGLSFFGLGAAPGYADWGQMLAGARDRVPSLARDWHVVAFPGGALALFALAWSLTGDALRDALDPRAAGGGHGAARR